MDILSSMFGIAWFVFGCIITVYCMVLPILIHLHLRKQTKYLKIISEK